MLHIPAEGQRVSQGQCSAEGGDGPWAWSCTVLLRKGFCMLFGGKACKTLTFLVVGIKKVLVERWDDLTGSVFCPESNIKNLLF